MKDLRKRLSVLGEKEAERYAKYNTVFEDEYHNDLRAHKAGFQALSEQVVLLAEALNAIQEPMVTVHMKGVEPGYRSEAEERIRIAREALRSLETFLGEGENNG